MKQNIILWEIQCDVIEIIVCFFGLQIKKAYKKYERERERFEDFSKLEFFTQKPWVY